MNLDDGSGSVGQTAPVKAGAVGGWGWPTDLPSPRADCSISERQSLVIFTHLKRPE